MHNSLKFELLLDKSSGRMQLAGKGEEGERGARMGDNGLLPLGPSPILHKIMISVCGGFMEENLFHPSRKFRKLYFWVQSGRRNTSVLKATNGECQATN